MEFEGQQWHYLQGPPFVGWHSSKIFALLPSERNDFYAPAPHDLDCESNSARGVPTQVMFSSLAYHLRVSGSRVRENLGRMA